MAIKVDLSKFNPDILNAANVRAEDVVGEINAWIPIQACKASSEHPGQLIVEGDATTDHKDYEAEEADQDGVMWDYHLKHGWLTDGHVKMEKATAGLGHPMEVKRYRRPDGHEATHYKAFLLDTPDNQKLHQTIEAAVKLKDSRFGFSIQGPVLRRSGPNNKRLAQILVTDVALTRHPVNPYATLTSVAKSMDAFNKGFDWSNPDLCCGGAVTRLLDMAEKALDAGHPDPVVNDRTDGAALIKQSLNGGTTMATCKKADFKKVFGDMTDEDMRKTAKGLNIELEDDDENDGKDKEDETAKAMTAALAEIQAHLASGGKVILDNGQADETMKSLVEATKSMQSGDEAVAKGIMAILSAVPAMTETMKAMRSELDDTKKSMDHLFGQPVLGKAVRPGAPIPTGRENVQTGDFVSTDVARKALSAAIIAESQTPGGGNRARIEQLGSAVQGVEARTIRMTKEDMAKLGVTLL